MLDFIKQIQRSDDKEKKKWMMIFSGITMIIVIILWVFYMNAFILNQSSDSQISEQSDTGFFYIFKAGLLETSKPILEKAEKYFSAVSSKIFSEKKNVTIENPE